MRIAMTEKPKRLPDSEKPVPEGWLALPFRRWCVLAGISFSHAYELAAAGELQIAKAGGRSLITRAEHDRFFAASNKKAA
jgi:hypothetical protein